MKRIATLLVAMAMLLPATAALLAPASAMAQGNSQCQAYNPQLCNITTNRSSDAGDGTLPFTGVDVALLAVGGMALLGTGLVIRRISKNAG